MLWLGSIIGVRPIDESAVSDIIRSRIGELSLVTVATLVRRLLLIELPVGYVSEKVLLNG